MENPVNEWTAHRFNDNYQIVVESTDQCVGVEHNQSEAEAIARYLSCKRAGRHIVRKNGPDLVRAAKAIRKECLRVPNRLEILAEMGVH